MAPRRTFTVTLSLLLLLVAAPADVLAAPIPLEFEGTLETLVAEGWDNEGEFTEYRLRTATEDLSLEFRGRAPEGFYTGARVRVRGHRDGAGVVVADGGTGSGTVLASAPGWSGSRKLAVVLINFSNDGSKPFSRSFANGVVFSNANSVRTYFAESSGGTASLTGTTFDWLRLPISNVGCDYRAWATAAKSGLAARGVDLSTYTNFLFFFPGTSACSWRGLGYLPGPMAWVNGTPSLRTPVHELGHNFGVHHASSLRCTSNGVRVALSANCTASEYGDPFTTMGAAGQRHGTTLARVQMGYLPAAATKTVTASGTYSIAKAFATSGVRVVGIPRGNGTWLYLEYRRPHGQYFDNFSTSSSVANGVTIRLAKSWGTIIQSSLIDTIPSTTTFNDAPLRLGKTFRDYLSGITITVSALGSGSATVAVKLPADTTAPSAPGSLHSTAVTTSSVSLAWSAATDNRAVAGYRVWRDGALVGTTSATTLSWTSSDLAMGTSHGFTVRAVDGAGNLGAAASLTVATSTPDAAPSAVTSLAASVTSTSARLTWGAATDDRGVAGYKVWQGGSLIASTTSRSLTVGSLTPASTYTWTVRAVDSAGQLGAATSVEATTLAPDVTPPTAVAASITPENPSWATLAWTAATDDVGVAGYRIYRDGALWATTDAGGRSLRVQTGSTYVVTAVDGAGNEGIPSTPVGA